MNTVAAYRYLFESGGRKHRCPSCGQRRFVRYVDVNTGEQMPPEFGRCDREQHCRYWRKPDSSSSIPFAPVIMPPAPPPSIMPPDIMAASVKHGHISTFARWLSARFRADIAAHAMKLYHLGASKHWDGANVFWQVDTYGGIRGGKVMDYDATGHRIKHPTNRVTWLHSILKLEGFNLRQCYFGEHLLTERPNDPVAIVESEKTAIVASIEVPEFVWIATGGKNGCRWKTDSTVNIPLKGRIVTLFPDLGAFTEWQHFAQRLRDAGAQVKVNDLLERYATDEDKAKGLDLADYLLRQSPGKNTQHGTAMIKDETRQADPVETPAAQSSASRHTSAWIPAPIDWAQMDESAPFEIDPF